MTTYHFSYKIEADMASLIAELEDSWFDRDYTRHVTAVFDLLDLARDEDLIWWNDVVLSEFKKLLLRFCKTKTQRMVIRVALQEINDQLGDLGSLDG